ncbi:DUF2442 domain-containing protein [Bradyrhizobium manausense]|uniref:DUF2442 domain-containing protein n=1 Tax=Bradyrhizobium manausense TaxID=989370 RepID=UPI002012B7B9|nr:DUF2442 domain-containing protein [Bradyrhizobium manausense]
MSTLEINIKDLRARSVDFVGCDLVVTLSDGRRIVTPIDWYPRLAKASVEQRENYEIMPMGIHWPDIDEDLSIAGMLKGNRVRSDAVKELMRLARLVPVSKESYELQRRSFVFGNTALDNALITRELVEQEADKLSNQT